MLKRVFKFLLLFIVLLAISAVLLLNSVNTQRNKLAIQQTILRNTGYELTIAGDMALNFFPSLGLILNDVRLKNPASPQELASTSAAVLQVNVRALFSGKLLIEELSTDDFHINYYIDAQGHSIWDVKQPGADDDDEQGIAARNTAQAARLGEQQAARTGSDADDDIVSVSFQRLRISNASIDIQDQSQGIRYSINNLDLESEDTNLEGRPFSLDIHFDFLNNGMSKPTSMGIRSNIIADINNGNISINDFNFNLTPMLLQGRIAITNINDAMAFEGSLESSTFDVMGLMQTLGVAETEPQFSVPEPDREAQQLAFNFAFSGDGTQVNIPNLTATLGNTELEANANLRFATEFTPNNISYNIISSSIDLTPFMTQDEEVAATETTSTRNAEEIEPGDISTVPPPPPTDTALPIDLLRSLNVLGSISIESLITNDMLFSNINIFTNVENSVLDIEVQPISVHEGTIQGNVRLDTNNEDAALSTRFSLEQINIIDLAPFVSRFNSITGKLNVEADYTASGSTTNALIESLSGSTTFAITENSVDIGVLKQVFTAISALSPNGGSVEQWPDVIRFSELGGYVLFDNGITQNQQVKLRMDNFDISGGGGINLAEQSFDYDLLFTVLGEPFLQTIQVDDLYHDVSWPVRCSANFDADVGQYCRPDFAQVREIFTQLGTNAVRSKLNESIINQVPEELQDSARGLLRGLLN